MTNTKEKLLIFIVAYNAEKKNRASNSKNSNRNI